MTIQGTCLKCRIFKAKKVPFNRKLDFKLEIHTKWEHYLDSWGAKTAPMGLWHRRSGPVRGLADTAQFAGRAPCAAGNKADAGWGLGAGPLQTWNLFYQGTGHFISSVFSIRYISRNCHGHKTDPALNFHLQYVKLGQMHSPLLPRTHTSLGYWHGGRLGEGRKRKATKEGRQSEE